MYPYPEWNINLSHHFSGGRCQSFCRVYTQLHYLSYTFAISQYLFFSLVVQSNDVFENSYSATSLSNLIHHSLTFITHSLTFHVPDCPSFQKFKQTILTITCNKLGCKFMNYVLY